jgi:hypothetical protein
VTDWDPSDWDPSPDATISHRLGEGPAELGLTRRRRTCPDIWELSDGNIAVVGVDMTKHYRKDLPEDLHIHFEDERLVVIPRAIFDSAMEAVELQHGSMAAN